MIDTPLHKAVIDNDIAELKRLISNLGDTLFEDELGYSPAEIALMLGRSDCAEALGVVLNPIFKILIKNHHILDMYTIGSFLEKMGVAYSPALRFRSIEEMRRIASSYPRLLAGKWGQEARDLGERWRKQMFSGEVANLTVGWVGEILEYGVENNRNLEEGDFIGEYTGLVRPVSRLTPLLNGYCVQYPTRWPNGGLYVIDARLHGNVLRYVNHSSKPNLRGQWALDRGLLHLLFFANETIPRGYPLTIDYGSDYWKFRRNIL